MDIKEKVKKLPLTPGVYLMKDSEGEVVYIGKANSLKRRVSSYFIKEGHSPKIQVLVTRIQDVDYIETPTEIEALLLEAQLINKHKPKYNTRQKDDKSFPLVKMTNETFPRLMMTRQKKDKKSKYYGPFTDARLLREALRLIHTIFPIRKCMTLPKTACLYYHIGQCVAPCIFPDIKKEYKELMDEVSDFLGGGKRNLVEYLQLRMESSAKELCFEEAQIYKEQIQALVHLKKKRFHIKKPEKSVTLSATSELRKILKLNKYPERIVCFDVSNTFGSESVASKVSFYREMPDKFDYRRYKIKAVLQINDYAMMQEAVRRMLRRLKESKEELDPDIILIDGGKGHLNAVYKVLQEEGFDGISLISIAKRFEQIYTVGSTKPLNIAKDSPVLHMLQKVRDESHRFAIEYHRKLRDNKVTDSVLDKIEGVGETRKKVLLNYFGSVKKIEKASVEEISSIVGISDGLARKIKKELG